MQETGHLLRDTGNIHNKDKEKAGQVVLQA